MLWYQRDDNQGARQMDGKPMKLKKGTYEGRWEVFDASGTHRLGWVVKTTSGLWDAYVSTGNVTGRKGTVIGRKVGWACPLRRDAVDEVWITATATAYRNQ